MCSASYTVLMPIKPIVHRIHLHRVTFTRQHYLVFALMTLIAVSISSTPCLNYVRPKMAALANKLPRNANAIDTVEHPEKKKISCIVVAASNEATATAHFYRRHENEARHCNVFQIRPEQWQRCWKQLFLTKRTHIPRGGIQIARIVGIG